MEYIIEYALPWFRSPILGRPLTPVGYLCTHQNLRRGGRGQLATIPTSEPPVKPTWEYSRVLWNGASIWRGRKYWQSRTNSISCKQWNVTIQNPIWQCVFIYLLYRGVSIRKKKKKKKSSLVRHTYAYTHIHSHTHTGLFPYSLILCLDGFSGCPLYW